MREGETTGDGEVPSPGLMLKLYQHRAKKRFGQHFLSDERILGRVVEACGAGAEDRVLEIGPGCGTLTAALLRAPVARVRAVEIDRDAVTFLQETLGRLDRFELVEADALSLEPEALVPPLPEGGRPWYVAANLPYNVGTEVLFRLLQAGGVAQMALMFQREVARRLVAGPGDDGYGALSLMVKLHCEDAQMVMELKPGAFTPPPKVHSAVVQLRPLPDTRIPDEAHRERFVRLVRAAFNARRKTFPNAIKSLGLDKGRVIEALEALGHDPRIRPERLGFRDFEALADLLREG